MSALATAFVAMVGLYLLQLMAFVYLYSRKREISVVLWICGSVLLLGFSLAALFTELRGGMPRDEVVWLLLLLAAGMCISDGVLRFVGRPLPRIAWIMCTATGVWALVAWLIGGSVPVVSTPGGTFASIMMVASGVRVFRSEFSRHLGARISAVSMILWGLHFADYPILREVEWFAPVGFILAAILETTVALGLLVLHYEVSQERAAGLEAEREQSRKLEALGRMAGGIAHDFNNLLTVILFGTNTLRSVGSLSATQQRMAATAADAAERASLLTGQLLAFSQRRPRSSTVMDLSARVREVTELARSTVGDAVDVQVIAPDGPLWVALEPAQIDQIVVNLVVNARDAMPEGGQIRIRLAGVDDSDEGAFPGPHIRVDITDTGHGMTEDVARKALEPFFTTKDSGHGTGLGLAIVHGIVSQAGGRVELQCVVGEGTMVTLYFPISEKPPVEVAIEAALGEGSGTVLLAEDEPLVRQAAVEILEGSGYRVVGVASGDQALLAFSRDPSGIDVVVSDVVMPGLDGMALASELKKLAPDLPVLLTSGYPDRIASSSIPSESTFDFLAKPYTPQALLGAVAKVKLRQSAVSPVRANSRLPSQ